MRFSNFWKNYNSVADYIVVYNNAQMTLNDYHVKYNWEYSVARQPSQIGPTFYSDVNTAQQEDGVGYW